MFRMTTMWGQVLMFICRFVVYVSWHNTIFTGGVSIQKGVCKPDLPLSRHLRSTDHHDSFGKLKVTIIDHNPKWDDKSRQERESFWIRKLKTLSPNGINEKR
jgi:hypothetical protein